MPPIDDDDYNEARPTEKGSGDAQATFHSTDTGEEDYGAMDGMEIVEATDGRLGLTDIGDVPADDWAADTGPTRSSEEI